MRWALFPFLVVGQVAAEPVAEPRPDDESLLGIVERCVRQHDSAQISRISERWPEARGAMKQCADERCPVAIRSDCRAWLDELDKAMPTLLVSVQRDDGATTSATLELDGVSQTLFESTQVVEVYPGRHRLRISVPGYPPVEREVAVQSGQKNVVVRVHFVRPRAPKPLVTPVERPVPSAVYWYAGSSLAAFTVSGVLLASALSSRAEAERRCAPECGGTADSIRARLILADVSGAAGVALSALAAWSFFTRPTEPGPSSAVRAGVRFSSHGSLVVLEGPL